MKTLPRRLVTPTHHKKSLPRRKPACLYWEAAVFAPRERITTGNPTVFSLNIFCCRGAAFRLCFVRVRATFIFDRSSV